MIVINKEFGRNESIKKSIEDFRIDIIEDNSRYEDCLADSIF